MISSLKKSRFDHHIKVWSSQTYVMAGARWWEETFGQFSGCSCLEGTNSRCNLSDDRTDHVVNWTLIKIQGISSSLGNFNYSQMDSVSFQLCWVFSSPKLEYTKAFQACLNPMVPQLFFPGVPAVHRSSSRHRIGTTRRWRGSTDVVLVWEECHRVGEVWTEWGWEDSIISTFIIHSWFIIHDEWHKANHNTWTISSTIRTH